MRAKVVLPLAVLALALTGTVILIATSAPVAGRPSARMLRAVRVAPVEIRSVRLDVRTQGTVSPRTESELIPEISGRVVWTSPQLVSGGYFELGDVLLRVAREDFEANVEGARAALERALGEAKHARQHLERRRNLEARQVVSAAALDDAERAARVARANVREARVALERAERDLGRTEIRAPFEGRVREERVDVGQFLSRGQSFATLYATDFVEVRLPIADAQLAHLELPIWVRGAWSAEGPPVILSADFAGERRRWTGRLVRTEGEIDVKSRLVHVVARVANTGDGSIPLPVGLFVQARIQGRAVQSVAVVPRQALQGSQRVFVIDSDDRLRFRHVDVLRIDGDDALITGGLAQGERVCTSGIQAPVEGMRVQPVAPDADARPAGAPLS